MGGTLNGMATQDLMEVLQVSRTALECNTVDELIPEVLRRLEGIFKTGNCTFFFARHLARALNLDRVITRGIEENFLVRFRDYYHKQDPFLEGLQLPGTSVLTTEQVISINDLTRGEYYNDFLKPQSIHHQMSIYLRSDHRLLGILSLFRPRTAKCFSSRDMAKADLMAPHLSGALNKNMISQKMIERKSFIDAMVATLPHEGIMVLDASLDPVYQDGNATRVISRWNSSRKNPDQTISALLPEEIYNLCRRVLASAEGGRFSDPVQHRLELFHPDGGQQATVHVRLITGPENCPLLLLCINPKEKDFFAGLGNYGLTKRETEVVSLLSEGLPNKSIGKKLFISEYTVENHLRAIFRKMDVTNRTAVVCGLLQAKVKNNDWINELFLRNPGR